MSREEIGYHLVMGAAGPEAEHMDGGRHRSRPRRWALDVHFSTRLDVQLQPAGSSPPSSLRSTLAAQHEPATAPPQLLRPTVAFWSFEANAGPDGALASSWRLRNIGKAIHNL
jgi:hypothetical protein